MGLGQAIDAAGRVGGAVHGPEPDEQFVRIDAVQLAQRGQRGGLSGGPLGLLVQRVQRDGFQEMADVAVRGDQFGQDVARQQGRTIGSWVGHGPVLVVFGEFGYFWYVG